LKEYGKLNGGQFKELVVKLPEVRRYGREYETLLADLPRDEFDALMGQGFNWGSIYELSFVQHISVALIAFGQLAWLKSLEGVDDPQQVILDTWDREADDADVPEGFERPDLVGLAYSLQRTILSVMLFQQSLSCSTAARSSSTWTASASSSPRPASSMPCG
jgi:hypothetical protein